MSAKSDEYQRRAEEADKEAAKCLDPQSKRSYEQIAQKWREMAAQAKRNDW
jgi:hypothetical protein